MKAIDEQIADGAFVVKDAIDDVAGRVEDLAAHADRHHWYQVSAELDHLAEYVRTAQRHCHTVIILQHLREKL